MNNSYHAVIINLSQTDKSIFKRYNVLELKKRFCGIIKLYTISIPKDEIEEAVSIVQKNMSRKLKKEWYATFYNLENVVIVFRQKVFWLSPRGISPIHQQVLDTSCASDKDAWNEMISYAKSLGIPDNQLDFLPSGFENEHY